MAARRFVLLRCLASRPRTCTSVGTRTQGTRLDRGFCWRRPCVCVRVVGVRGCAPRRRVKGAGAPKSLRNAVSCACVRRAREVRVSVRLRNGRSGTEQAAAAHHAQLDALREIALLPVVLHRLRGRLRRVYVLGAPVCLLEHGGGRRTSSSRWPRGARRAHAHQTKRASHASGFR